MAYLQRIEDLIQNIDPSIVDFSQERKRGTAPTQVSSEFLTNKEQGDWAEKTLMKGINDNFDDYVAVKYGRDDDIIAGEPGFKEFYEDYQEELDTIGKRPDILVFRKADYDLDEKNISHLSTDVLDKVVPKALCGIEVRSSAFLIEKYESEMNKKTSVLTNQIMAYRTQILNEHASLLRDKNATLYDTIVKLNENNLNSVSFRVSSWSKTEEQIHLTQLIKGIKGCLENIQKRTYLSITPKVEDMKVVYNWIKRYNVPHYYVQVFFDKAYGISYERILTLLNHPELKDKEYFLEKDIKNQNKTTIKIHANQQACICDSVSWPIHHSKVRELGRGRMLYYVTFDESNAVINKNGFESLFGVTKT